MGDRPQHFGDELTELGADWVWSHLTDWFDNGFAPSDWNLSTLEDFKAWLSANATELPAPMSWPEAARRYERQA